MALMSQNDDESCRYHPGETQSGCLVLTSFVILPRKITDGCRGVVKQTRAHTAIGTKTCTGTCIQKKPWKNILMDTTGYAAVEMKQSLGVRLLSIKQERGRGRWGYALNVEAMNCMICECQLRGLMLVYRYVVISIRPS